MNHYKNVEFSNQIIKTRLYVVGVQCGVEEALRSVRNNTAIERDSAQSSVKIRTERAITMGKNIQLTVTARRPASRFPADVRETDRLSRLGAGLCLL